MAGRGQAPHSAMLKTRCSYSQEAPDRHLREAQLTARADGLWRVEVDLAEAQGGLYKFRSEEKAVTIFRSEENHAITRISSIATTHVRYISLQCSFALGATRNNLEACLSIRNWQERHRPAPSWILFAGS